MAELRSAMTQCGNKMSLDEANEMLILADTNGDGVINYEGVCNFKLKSMSC